MQPDWMDFYLFVALLALFIYVLAANNITTLHKAYLAFHSSMMMWPFCHFFINIIPDTPVQWLFLNIAFVSICNLGYGWLIFSLVLTKRFEGIKGSSLFLMAIPALICALLISTNPWHNMFAYSLEGWLIRGYGPFFWLFVLTNMSYLIVSTVLMLRTMAFIAQFKDRSKSNLIKQLRLCLGGLVLLLLFALTDVLFNVILFPAFGVVPGLTSTGIILSALCFVIAIKKYDLFQIINIAQREAIESMDTGFIVVDRDEMVLDANRSAVRYFDVKPGQDFNLESMLEGSGAQFPGGFVEDYKVCGAGVLRAEITLQREGLWHIAINVAPLRDSRNKLLGRIISLNDVTELRNLLDSINNKNDMLQLQNDELLRVQKELHEANEKLSQMAVTDGLTGCYNKRYLMFHLVSQVDVARRYKTPFCLIIFDLDHFKKINDTHGHLAGDGVLREVVGTVKNNLRKADVLARFGGEEFVIYLPHTKTEGAYLMAEKIRVAVQENVISMSENLIKVTISIGLAGVDDMPDNIDHPEIFLEKLLARADSALYQAKSKGRNRVVLADGGYNTGSCGLIS